MVLVLAAAGLFVYLRLQADLDESVDAGLGPAPRRWPRPGRPSAGAAGDPEEGFAQRLAAGGVVLDAAGGARRPALTEAELEQAARQAIELERRVPGVEGTARMVAGPAPTWGAAACGGRRGQSLEDRDETLAGLAASFAIGGPIAVLLASLLGYALAAAGLRPSRRCAAGRRGLARASRRAAAAAGGARRDPPAGRDAQRDARSPARRATSASGGSWPTPATSCARPLAVIKTELESALRAGGHEPRGARGAGRRRRGVRPASPSSPRTCWCWRAAATGGCRVRPRAARGPRAARAGARPLRRPRARARARDPAWTPPTGLRVEADELRLRQALVNLVDNALRYGEGEVVLRGECRRRRDRSSRWPTPGPGFRRSWPSAPSSASRAATRARARGGTGLGLAIVRAIAEAHGGTRRDRRGGPGARCASPSRRRCDRSSGRSQRAVVASPRTFKPMRGGTR